MEKSHYVDLMERAEQRAKEPMNLMDVDSVLLEWLGVDRVKNGNRKIDKRERYQAVFSHKCFEDEDESNDINTGTLIACLQHEAKNPEELEKQLQKDIKMSFQEERNVRKIFDLPRNKRWNLYRLWRDKLERKCQKRIFQSQRLGYETEQKKLSEIDEAENFEILRQAKVIAMTTTCAAKYHAILQRIGPKIVLVEEAAEVLEAHILTSISSECEHLILIGDHQQLRPSCTVYDLARKYHLNISMFERLVNLGVPCERLSEQHRMRPEIATLMEHIYDKLTNHDSVKEFEDIRGIKKNLFFLDHRNPEETSEDTHSHVNEYEATFLAKLSRYLIQQDYAPSDITILTPYLGQMFKIKDKLGSEAGELYKQIRISTIDNFQGEENEIILLSLVRSNDDNRVGFVNDINRACVALSRARKGLYVIGNFKALTAASKIWKNVVSSMISKEQFGEALPLFCPSHKTEVLLKEPKEFLEKVPRGGCTLPCQYRLHCGHVCTLPCHPYDPDHNEFKCMDDCTKIIPGCDNNHKCQNKCWEQCTPECLYKVERKLTCGHIRKDVQCRKKLEEIKCVERCEKKLSCGHQCQNKCGESCTRNCQEFVKRTDWPCNHNVTIACSATPLKCKVPCSTLVCGHTCSGNCGECLQGRVHKPCKNECGKTLVCSHICQAKCAVACPPCSEVCQNSCSHSRCKERCGEPCTPCKYECKWECKHLKCTRLCGEMCDRPRCDIKCNKLVVKCQHKCRGLCGESCICVKERCNDKENIQEIFGTEEFADESVRFIRLKDCNHIFEVSGLDRWMDMCSSGEGEDNEAIQMKACPCCKTPIRNTKRYTSVINERLADIERVKITILGDQTALASKKIQVSSDLSNYLAKLKSMKVYCTNQDRHKKRCEKLKEKVEKCKTIYQVSFLENQVNFLRRCQKLAGEMKKAIQAGNDKAEESLDILEYLTTKRIIGCSVAREIADINLEITRQSVRFQVYSFIFELNNKEIPMDPDHKFIIDGIINQLSQSSKTREQELECFLKNVKDVRSKYPIDQLTEEEKKEIVAAIGLSKGHWYKCPNGHIYAIGECGGAMQKATCPVPECKSIIGGERHKLAEGNSVASEMDGAQYAAWSEQANLENYEIIDEV